MKSVIATSPDLSIAVPDVLGYGNLYFHRVENVKYRIIFRNSSFTFAFLQPA